MASKQITSCSRPSVETKTYFWVAKFTSEEIKNGKTDSKVFTFKFPPEFIASRNSKWIVIEECKAIFKNQLVGDVLLHADFIHRDHYLDYSCCFVNEEANKDTAKDRYKGMESRRILKRF